MQEKRSLPCGGHRPLFGKVPLLCHFLSSGGGNSSLGVGSGLGLQKTFHRNRPHFPLFSTYFPWSPVLRTSKPVGSPVSCHLSASLSPFIKTEPEPPGQTVFGVTFSFTSLHLPNALTHPRGRYTREVSFCYWVRSLIYFYGNRHWTQEGRGKGTSSLFGFPWCYRSLFYFVSGKLLFHEVGSYINPAIYQYWF